MSPRRSLRPCAVPGCPELTSSTRCQVHTREHTEATRRKDPAQRKFYGSARWKKIRELVLKRDPVCVLCGVRPSRVVDHFNPDDPDGPADWRDNRPEALRGLCTTCERGRTGRQHRAKQDDPRPQRATREPWYFV